MIRPGHLRSVPYPWVVVAMCVLTTMAGGFFVFGLGVLYPFIQEDLDINRAQLGLIASGRSVGASVAALLVGWMFDVLGVRRMLTVARVGMVVGVLLFSQVQSLAQAVALAVLIGIAISAEHPAFAKAIMDWVAPRTRGLAMGLAEASVPIGGIISAVPLTLLAVAYGWRPAMVVVALIFAVAIVVFNIFYRDKPSERADKGKRRSQGGRVSTVARDRDIWLAALFSAALTGSQSVVMTYLVLFLKEEMDMSAVVAGAGLAVAMGGSAVGRISWGLATDWVLRDRRAATLALLGILSATSLALMTRLPLDAPLAMVWGVLFLIGATVMAWPGVWGLLLAELAGPNLTGTAIGFAGTIMRMGPFITAPLFGLIVDKSGSYDVGWWMAAGLAGLGTLLLAFLRPQAHRGVGQRHRPEPAD